MKNSVYKRHIGNFSSHWWFQARKKILEKVIKKNLKENLNILDFGAGSGTNIKMLSKYGFVNIYEPHFQTQKYLRIKYKNKKKYKILNKIDNKKFDLIVLADVLEHIKNDKNQIKKLATNLSKNGHILITVPAYQFLFSSKDSTLKHFRRYNKGTIQKIFSKFSPIRLTYFNFFLFPPIAITIIICKILDIKFIKTVENAPIKFINRLLFNVFIIEKKIINILNFPFGLSILGLFKKK